MKRSRIYFFAVLVGLPLLPAFGLLVSNIGYGQSPDPPKSSATDAKRLVKPTILIIDRAGKPIVNNEALAAAAAANLLTLSNEFAWTFGSKEQHGWFLYAPLIKRLVGADDPPASKGFAVALARWQQTSGLSPTGVLDEESLDTMIGKWQAARIQNRDLAPPDQLVTVPATEFYDPERLEELRQVEKTAYAAYHKMLAAAFKEPSLHLATNADGGLAANEKFLKIISAFRSREYQEKLRRQSPKVGRAGLAINSPHFTGRALDLYVGGDPVDTKDTNRALQIQTPVYQWLVRNAEKFGFRPYFYEPWHWEYVGEPDK
ncbi:MAG TPA: D-alanyl-D-alanine carboxypeptidase family protein [Pyrinomonadaceae bacterium]|nr:D-alanyl-D-alanine carboxypeptidase family protein [Pyrinomonadaceae bacterium]